MKRWLWVWSPAVLQMAAIFAASSLSRVPSLPAGLTNHTGHFIGYALLAALMMRGLGGARWWGMTRGAAWRAVAISSLYGVSDEFHQSFVPGRASTFSDWVADTLGAGVGVALVLWRVRVIRRRHASRSV